MKSPNITPQPGYILCISYIPKDVVFKKITDDDVGVDTKSVVLKVGDSVVDSNGQLRETNAKPEDIIVHAYSNKEFMHDSLKYRFVHFTEVHGIENK